MEYFCEKTVEVFEDHMIIHQGGGSGENGEKR